MTRPLTSARSRRRADSSAETFTAAYRAHRAEIKRRCAAILHDEADADDATEETFARAWRALAAGELHGELRPWLRVVSRNVCFDVYRKRRHSRSFDMPTLEAIGPSDGGSDLAVLRGIDESFVRESIRRMPPSYQSILALREDLELSYAEIADREQISVATVESRLYRARCALRREFLALVGQDGLASVIWLRIRAHLLGAQPTLARLLGCASESVTPDTAVSAVAPASTVGGVIAATAVAALATVGAVHIAATPHPTPPPPPSPTTVPSSLAPIPPSRSTVPNSPTGGTSSTRWGPNSPPHLAQQGSPTTDTSGTSTSRSTSTNTLRISSGDRSGRFAPPASSQVVPASSPSASTVRGIVLTAKHWNEPRSASPAPRSPATEMRAPSPSASVAASSTGADPDSSAPTSSPAPPPVPTVVDGPSSTGPETGGASSQEHSGGLAPSPSAVPPAGPPTPPPTQYPSARPNFASNPVSSGGGDNAPHGW